MCLRNDRKPRASSLSPMVAAMAPALSPQKAWARRPPPPSRPDLEAMGGAPRLFPRPGARCSRGRGSHTASCETSTPRATKPLSLWKNTPSSSLDGSWLCSEDTGTQRTERGQGRRGFRGAGSPRATRDSLSEGRAQGSQTRRGALVLEREV
uniref:Uncharacterized protein n=1 Tax=Myotis myotis TaxID=51298 RepID=A0A7J7V3Q3_MYOMY|nr:hypothetical protein mMyoMyo1_008417 [Myotis myotis]